MLKKLFIFGVAAMIGLSLVLCPIASNVQAGEKAETKISWMYESMYIDVLNYILMNGDFNPYTFSVMFNDPVNGTFWEIYLFHGFIIMWEKDMPREGTYFASFDFLGNDFGVDGFGMMLEDGELIMMSNAEVYMAHFHQHLCKFYWTYIHQDTDTDTAY